MKRSRRNKKIAPCKTCEVERAIHDLEWDDDEQRAMWECRCCHTKKPFKKRLKP